MKKIILLLSTAAFMISCSQENLKMESAPIATLDNATTAGTAIPGKYIVVLKGEVQIKGMPAAVRAKVLAILTRNGANQAAIDHVFSSALQGFAGSLNAAQLKSLQNDPNVDYIEARSSTKYQSRKTQWRWYHATCSRNSLGNYKSWWPNRRYG